MFVAYLNTTLGGSKSGPGNAYAQRRRRNPNYPSFGTPRATQKPATTPGTSPYVRRAPVVNPSNEQGNLLFRLANEKAQAATPTAPVAVNYDADPILMRIRALQAQNVQDAQSEAARIKNQAAIDYGIPDASGIDATTAEAARQNPFSVMSNIAKQQTEGTRSVDQTRNTQNLFYSGTRAQDLTDLGTRTAQAQTEAQGGLRDIYSQADAGVLAAQQAAAAAEQQRIEAAAEEQRQAQYAQALADQQASFQNDLYAALASGYDTPMAAQAGTSYYPEDTAAGYFERNPMPAGTTTEQALAALGSFAPATYDFSYQGPTPMIDPIDYFRANPYGFRP